MKWKPILKMALVTMGTMLLANQLAAMNPTLRKILKGEVLAPVSGGTGTITPKEPQILRV